MRKLLSKIVCGLLIGSVFAMSFTSDVNAANYTDGYTLMNPNWDNDENPLINKWCELHGPNTGLCSNSCINGITYMEFYESEFSGRSNPNSIISLDIVEGESDVEYDIQFPSTNVLLSVKTRHPDMFYANPFYYYFEDCNITLNGNSNDNFENTTMAFINAHFVNDDYKFLTAKLTNNPEEDRFIQIYETVKSMDWSGDNVRDYSYIISCFFDKEEFCFKYYLFEAGRDSGDKDYCFVRIYKTDRLHIPTVTDAIGTSIGEYSPNNNNTNILNLSYDEINLRLYQCLEYAVKQDVATELAVLPGMNENYLRDLSAEWIDANFKMYSKNISDSEVSYKILPLIDTFSVYLYKESPTSSLTFNNSYSYADNNIIHSNKYVGVGLRSAHLNNSTFSNVYAYQAYEDIDNKLTYIRLDDDWGEYTLREEQINWDLTTEEMLESGVNIRDINNTYTAKIIDLMISLYAQDVMRNVQVQSEISNAEQMLDNSFIDSSFMEKFLEAYSEQLLEAINNLALEDYYSSLSEAINSNGLKELKSYREVLIEIIRLNIASMDASVENTFFNEGYYHLGTGYNEILYISSTGDTVAKGNDSELYSNPDFDEATRYTVYSVHDILMQLPEVERRQIIYMYQNAWLLYSTYGGDVRTSIKLTHPNQKGFSETLLASNPEIIDANGLSFPEYTAGVVDDVNASADGTILSYLKYVNAIGTYAAYYNLYGVSAEGDQDIYALYNATIETATLKRYCYDMNEFYFPSDIIHTRENDSNINKILGQALSGPIVYSENNSIDDTWNLRYASFLFNVAYGFEICNGKSQTATEEGYSAYSIAKAFGASNDELSKYSGNGNNKEEMSAVTGDIGTSNFESKGNGMLRAVIELHDYCEFMGIKKGDWTTDIDDYLMLYDYLDSKGYIEQLRSNINLYSVGAKGSVTEEEPLGEFFNISNSELSEQWIRGFALSATYSPMNTNLYDSSSIEFISDVDWITDFYYKYGFYRKALYINTDNSAIVNKFVSGVNSGSRVATLGDLLNYDRDIILTVDDNFYNAEDVDKVISQLDYSSVRNNNPEKSEDTEVTQDVFLNVGELFTINAEVLLKTNDVKYYNADIQQGCTQLGGAEDESLKSIDAYLLTKKDILRALQNQEYSIEQPMAVVSAIYKSDALFNHMLKSISVDNAIFKSSRAIVDTPGTNEKDWLALYNYCMLANLSEQMKNDSASTLDLDAPIFCDIFGNIVTESGLVIIPAASNATLCNGEWTPLNVGWADLYYNGNMLNPQELNDKVLSWLTGSDIEDGVAHLTASNAIDKDMGGGWFAIENDHLLIRTTEVSSAGTSAVIQWDMLSKNSDKIKQVFYNQNYYTTGPKLYNYVTSNMIVEVLRGAPIESIDYREEGLNNSGSITKGGVYLAYLLEQLCDTFITKSEFDVGNSMLAIPNLAFMEGIEYIILYVFKIGVAFAIIALVINLYLDAVQNELGIKAMFRFILTCVMTILAVTLAPNFISWTYYTSNKQLLTDDIAYVYMLNYTKDFDGSEVGITSVTTPESDSELYLKLDDISIDWWSVIYEVLFTNTYSTVSELYNEQLKDNPYVGEENIIVKSDGIYLSVNDLLDSTAITYLPGSNTLANYTYSESHNLVGSFASPYYYFLDQLVTNVNQYNSMNAVESYSYGVGQNGHIMTYELTSAYFSSNMFLETGYDILNLHYLFRDSAGATPMNIITNETDRNRMVYSLWWPDGRLTDENLNAKVDEIYTYARNWINKNRNVMGKVPDEVFLKTLALQLAIKYNQEFNIPAANSIEIMNVDSRDILRLMVGDKGSVYKYYSYSFPRFVYEEGGGSACIAAAIFIALLWVGNLAKPFLMIVIMILLVFNVLARRTLYRKQNKCIEGYLISMGALGACNILYAFFLKLLISISEFGIGATGTFLAGSVLQVLYMTALASIINLVVKDWHNNGYFTFKAVGDMATHNIHNILNGMANRMFDRGARRSNVTGNRDFNDMMDSDEQRERSSIDWGVF